MDIHDAEHEEPIREAPLLWSRIISGTLAICYVVAAFLVGGRDLAARYLIASIIPMGCIWFSDAMGQYVGQTGSRPISRTTPGCFVAFGGWLVLITLGVFLVFIAASGNG